VGPFKPAASDRRLHPKGAAAEVSEARTVLARPLVAFANRLPVARVRGEWRAAAGGLVTALRPALQSRGGSWVGWDGGAADLPRSLPGLEVELHPVRLSRTEVAGYYHNFSNRTLWPLLHGLVEQPVFERSWWRTYRAVNERFAAEVPPPRPGLAPLEWVHDYHLMLLPGLLRAEDAGRATGFFLHVPFPAPELFVRLPWRREIVDGLLGADVVSFQTEEFRDNFVRTCVRLHDDIEVDGDTITLPDRRLVRTTAHPISIDARDFAARATTPTVERRLRQLQRQFEGRRVLLGVDRLDYTKGIPERLRAIELLFELRPELRRRLAFVQIAIPSRGEVREYRDLRTHVEELVGRINGRFTDPGADVPVHYLFRGITPDRLLAYYRLADVCLVTPLRDGMNLVAKEFVTVQAAVEGSGVLVLSEFAGAAEELRSALLCNPFDLDGLAATIERALQIDETERRERLQRLAATVAAHDVFWWVEHELNAVAHAPVAAT
jgi:trehalose 6-phosphate synthase